MKGTTHFFAGAATAVLFSTDPTFIATAAFAALIPDIDEPTSYGSRMAAMGHLRGILGLSGLPSPQLPNTLAGS